MHKVSVHGLKIHAFHGLLPIEEERGNDFELDIDIAIDLYHAASSDNILDSIDYIKVVDLVKQEMAIRSKIMESVALRIIRAIKAESGDITRVKVTIKKLTAPIEAELDAVSVTLDA